MRLVIPITLESPIHLDAIIPQKTLVDAPPSIEMATPKPASVDSAPITAIEDSETSYIPPVKPHIKAQDTSYEPEPYVEPTPPSRFEQAFDAIKSISIWTYMLVIWAIGAIILIIRALVEYLRFKHRVNTDRQINDPTISNIATECKAALHLDKKVSIITCPYVRTPVTFGFMRPIVLLPVGIAHKLGEHKLQMVILHELCHIKRKDIFKNYLWLIAKVISWFNPLVYIAYKQHIHSIELACDEMVLKNIGSDDSFDYTQSLLDVLRMSRSQKVAPVALSFCQDKKKIRKRVENMITPQRKLKSAGFISILLAVAMVIGCFTTACQPAATHSIEPSPTNNISHDITPDSASDKTFSFSDIPSHVDKVLSPKTENVSVKFDADVKVPESTTFPIVELVPKKITQEQVDNFLDTFFKNRVDNLTTEFERPYTKSEIQEQIKLREKWIKDTKKNMSKEAAEKSIYIPKWEKQIEKYKEFMKEAFDDISEIPKYDVTKFAPTPKTNRVPNISIDYDDTDLELLRNEELYNTKHLNYGFNYNNIDYGIYAKQSDNPYHNFFSVYQMGNTCLPFEYDTLAENYEDIPQLKTTYKQAKSLADKALNALDIEGMDLYKASNYNNNYCFIYTWDVEGTNVTYTSDFYSASHFSIVIDDNGIACANYSRPVEYKSTFSIKIEFMPFENIIKKACDTFSNEDYLYSRFASNPSTYDLEVKKYDAVIEKVELGYRMGEGHMKDGLVYTLMPVWYFFGQEEFDLVYHYDSDETDYRNHRDEYCTTKSILIISARTGEVIGEHLYLN
jgi:beta-lactamase regulating signal transducer with metallopeptidase domain